MIKSIQLKNFQSHKDTTIELTEGINSIVGPSDNGKSAVIRGLLWVLYNRPLGDAYISTWAKAANLETFVKVEVNGHTICRTRSKSFNGYYVDGDKLEAMGTSVPEEITKIFNMSEANIQAQQDPAFLLSASGSEIDKFFNSIVKLEDMDKALALCESKKREEKKDTKRLSGELEENEKALKKFEGIEAVGKVLRRAQSFDTRITNKSKKLSSLTSSASDYEAMQKTVNQYKDLGKIEEVLKAAATAITEYEDKCTLENDLALDVGNYEFYQEQIDHYKVDTIEPLITRLESMLARLNKKEAKRELLVKSSGEFLKLKAVKIQSNTDVKELEKQFPEICPLCGSAFMKENV